MPGSPGNKNALKHGIYSSMVPDPGVDNMPINSNRHEIALARSRLKSALTEYNKSTDTKDRLAWDFACRHWLDLIMTGINHNVVRPQMEGTIYTTLLDALRAANDRRK